MAENSGLFAQRLLQSRQTRERVAPDEFVAGQMHGGWKGVVGTLTGIDVIVGFDVLVNAEIPAEQLGGSIGKHLVQIHVGLRA
jgi:hypothetical protein